MGDLREELSGTGVLRERVIEGACDPVPEMIRTYEYVFDVRRPRSMRLCLEVAEYRIALVGCKEGTSARDGLAPLLEEEVDEPIIEPPDEALVVGYLFDTHAVRFRSRFYNRRGFSPL